MYTFRICRIKLFIAHPKYAHETNPVRQIRNLGTHVRVRAFNSGLLAREVGLQPEAPATGHFHQGFPWVSSAPEQILSWYIIPSFTTCFTCSPSNVNIKIKSDHTQ
jgi:hypothetical protein